VLTTGDRRRQPRRCVPIIRTNYKLCCHCHKRIHAVTWYHRPRSTSALITRARDHQAKDVRGAPATPVKGVLQRMQHGRVMLVDRKVSEIFRVGVGECCEGDGGGLAADKCPEPLDDIPRPDRFPIQELNSSRLQGMCKTIQQYRTGAKSTIHPGRQRRIQRVPRNCL
jgi:hypothetical protein